MNSLNKYIPESFLPRLFGMLAGVFIMGFAVSLFVLTDLGTDPFTTMNLGISSAIGWSFGTWQAVMNIFLIVICFFLSRKSLGAGTLANMFLIGFVADLFKFIWSILLPGSAEWKLWTKLLVSAAAILIFLVACSFYIVADLGISPYDCISFALPEKLHIPFRLLRVIFDVSAVAIGYFTGAAVGINTVVMAFFTGPLLVFFNKQVAGRFYGRFSYFKTRS